MKISQKRRAILKENPIVEDFAANVTGKRGHLSVLTVTLKDFTELTGCVANATSLYLKTRRKQ
jgi:hypothetical protein